jgi:hypothetical protein
VKNQGGFTILEVSLFLAISTAVAAALFVGLTTMVQNQQWRDSINSMRTLVQSEYQNVRAGLNDRTKIPSSLTNGGAGALCKAGSLTNPNTAGTSSCLVIGRVIQFYEGNTSFYATADVIATKSVSVAEFPTDIAALNGSNLRVANLAVPTMPWRNPFYKGAVLNTTSGRFDTVAILRSPVSGAVLVFALNTTDSTTNKPSILTNQFVLADAGGKPDGDKAAPLMVGTGALQLSQTNNSLAIVIKNEAKGGNNGGAICIGAGSSSSNVTSVATIQSINTITNINLNSLCTSGGSST